MTQDEIIRMAREAGLALTDHGHPEGYAMFCERLERFAALVAAHAKSEQINLAYQQGYEEGSAHEREACAKACDMVSLRFFKDRDDLEQYGADECAAAIRARGM